MRIRARIAHPLARWRTLIALGALGALGLALGACESDQGTPFANRLPTTSIVLGPNGPQTIFEVEIRWTGSDSDGFVDRFEWRISDNGADGMLDVGDTLGLPWHSTAATDSIFTVTADMDSFEADVNNPELDPRDWRFWQTHTFFVRSVDNEGGRDLSPASVSFTAVTIAPETTIDIPSGVDPSGCLPSGTTLSFGWSADDPDGAEGVPEETRYALVDIADLDPEIYDGTGIMPLAAGECMTRDQYELLNPVGSFPENAWSEWEQFFAEETPGVEIFFDNLPIGSSYLFAVQARDAAGAVNPTFEWDQSVRHVQVADNLFPILTLEESLLGELSFVGTQNILGFDAIEGQVLELCWSADASQYSGVIEAYRYGLDVDDPGNPDDPGWLVPWGNFQEFELTLGSEPTEITVQARDNSGNITRAVLAFDVVVPDPLESRRDLLFIEDWGFGQTPAELAIQQDWKAQWVAILETRVATFDRDTDYLVAADAVALLDLARLLQYRAVIWFTNGASEFTVYHSLVQAPVANARFNWLHLYQMRGGNVLLAGPSVVGGPVNQSGLGPWTLSYPIVFSTLEAPPLGFGRRVDCSGDEIGIGATLWPSVGLCVEAVDFVRPPLGLIFDEQPGNLLRSFPCEYLAKARPADDFLAAFPSASGIVRELEMSDARIPVPGSGSPDPSFKLQWEEFYNFDATTRGADIDPRNCFIPMFTFRAARDEVYPSWHPDAGDPIVVDPDANCPSSGSSPLDGAPIAFASTKYRTTKPLIGSEDFVWGFHPLGFEADAMADALIWIVGERWGIPVFD